MSIGTYDLFEDDEFETYWNIISLSNQIAALELEKKNGETFSDPSEMEKLKKEKRIQSEKLSSLIASHAGKPRKVQPNRVLMHRKFVDANGNVNFPEYITWDTLKISRRIAEFASIGSRAMGLKHNDVTFDKIIVKWKSVDMLEQIVRDGFLMTVKEPSGDIVTRHYHLLTASAGQLRTDKIQFISDSMWQKIEQKLQCGLTWDKINANGGINANKFMAYVGVGFSAVDPWETFNIDKAIVVDEFEADVTGKMQYIRPDYTSEIGTRTVSIDHTDGCGMMLPRVSRHNFMVRGPWVKGLLTPFDYLSFCKEKGVPAKMKDVWGKEHDLIAEDIEVIFTKSQVKLWKYYPSWDAYKANYKKYGCSFARTNYEEDYISDTDICYQMLQTLTDFTDEELDAFCESSVRKIENLARDQNAMLRTLGADANSPSPYLAALAIYPELLRDGYAKESLKAIKKRMVLNSKSGKIRCHNKRLFAIPDMYAACEFWFCGDKHPKGLLADGEVYCQVYANKPEVAVLRSPHLYMEWTVRKMNTFAEVRKWFISGGIYTSCHDLISRVLQFDNDGDQLNTISDPLLIKVAKRNLEKYHVLPLFYDLGKASAEPLSYEALLDGLKRAHEFSGIGQVSNSLTKLWNRPNPDREVASWLCYYNNQVIDAAKNGQINPFKNYPGIQERVNRAIGGKSGRMPYFFQYSKNGRKERNSKARKKKIHVCAADNDATMNRLCRRFNNIGRMNMNYAGIPPFNWQMLMPETHQPYRKDLVELFCRIDDENLANVIEGAATVDAGEASELRGYDFVAEMIADELVKRAGSLEAAYPSIVKYLFVGDNFAKQTHKQMFWRVFGAIALKTLKENLSHSQLCPKCGIVYPHWEEHVCIKHHPGFFVCADCGKSCVRKNPKQKRCPSCQEQYARDKNTQSHAKAYALDHGSLGDDEE